MRSGLLSSIKQLVVPQGEAPRTIKTGPFRGLRMNLSLTTQSQIYAGLFEREVYAQLRRLSEGLKTAVDIGAACGEYTLYFLARTTARRIFAFEPSAEGRARLKENLSLNSLGNDSRLELSARFVTSADNEESCSLDALLPSVELPCLIKMDIDGGEVAVLEGAKEVMRLPRVRWLIETHSPWLESRCISLLELNGYETRIIRNAWWRWVIPEQRPIEQNRWLVAGKRSDVQL